MAKNQPNKNVDFLDFWAKDEQGRYWHICEGTGDNLLPEDVKEGYVDYIYFSIYEGLDDVNQDDECDGGMTLLKTYYQDHTLEEIVKFVEEAEDVELEVLE